MPSQSQLVRLCDIKTTIFSPWRAIFRSAPHFFVPARRPGYRISKSWSRIEGLCVLVAMDSARLRANRLWGGVLEKCIECGDGLEDPRTDNAALHDFHEILIIAISTILSGGQSAVERGPVRRLRALPGHPEFCDRKRIAQEQFLRVPRGPRLMANCACRAGSQNEHACPARPACLRRIGGPSNNWDVQIVGLQSGIIEKAP